MKQAIKTTRMFALGLFSLCMTGLSAPSFAGTQTENPIEFKFIGKIKNRPVFQLNLNNDLAEEYSIRIKDQNYDVLYTEKVKAQKANFSRNYGLEIEEGDLNDPAFAVIVEVTSSKTHQTQVYKISSHRSVTENIVVAKL